jgi:tRNA G10  N-methylase Trm11
MGHETRHKSATTPRNRNINPPSPKQSVRPPIPEAGWYRYYAGFSPEFARYMVSECRAKHPEGLVVDPWNGAGTTTHMAAHLGMRSAGFDLNPAMTVAAKARLLGQEVNGSLRSIAADILAHANEPIDRSDSDPLEHWFQPAAAAFLRALEQASRRLLVEPAGAVPQGSTDPAEPSFSSLAAFYYVVLFRTVRKLLSPLYGSNPTWVRMPSTAKRLRPRQSTIRAVFLAQVEALIVSRDGASNGADYKQVETRVLTADSRALPLGDDEASAVISSPPYCTRLDYAVATRPELAVLGMRDSEAVALRRRLLGTTTVEEHAPRVDAKWGPTCRQLLQRIAEHPSKASAGYYLKTHLQYFQSLYDSFLEIDRVLKTDGSCTLVLQDSYYKDVHNDLPRIAEEMGKGIGWRLLHKQNFEVRRVLSALRHRDPNSQRIANEGVLHFEKAYGGSIQ